MENAADVQVIVERSMEEEEHEDERCCVQMRVRVCCVVPTFVVCCFAVVVAVSFLGGGVSIKMYLKTKTYRF